MDGFQMAARRLVPMSFGIRLGESSAAPKGVSERMDFKMASFLTIAAKMI